MEGWLELVLRQLMLYSLPVIISLTLVASFEAWRDKGNPSFAALTEMRTWLPMLAAILFHRGIIVGFPRPSAAGPIIAARRFLAHATLCLIGALLYAWSLHHASPYGLPPMHYWWSKVLMFFNLCMCTLHLLPLPGMLVGEWIAKRWLRFPSSAYRASRGWAIGLAMLTASPLLDVGMGGLIIFPIYEWIATQLARL